VIVAGRKFNPPQGRPPVLEWVDPALLGIDDSYQRSLEAETSQRLIGKLAANWNWDLCEPLQVARRSDGSLWIVDGQHRHAAAVMRGDIPHIPCVIKHYDDRTQEAATFVALNKQRRPLGSVDVFKATLAAGDEDARAVMQIITDAGLSLARHQNCISWKAGQLYCVPTIRRGYRAHGRIVVSAALCALSEAFENQVLQFAGQMVEGLIAFYATVLREPGFDPDLFVDRLAKNSQSEWVRRARGQMIRANVSRGRAMADVLMQAYITARQDQLIAA
jgi:hypothetical protein